MRVELTKQTLMHCVCAVPESDVDSLILWSLSIPALPLMWFIRGCLKRIR